MASPDSLEAAILEAKKVIEKHHSFVLFEHEKPDGDCVGSGLALVQALQNLGKQALWFLPTLTRQSTTFFRVTSHESSIHRG